ncbi:MAG: LptF/LptG family permease [Alphaproteobacteria bacterium]|nr:LptF/LptG family permease [Alphaproteobacteria bacterium]
MQILSRYILKNLFRGVITVTLVLTGVAWLTQILRLFSLVLERGLSLFSFLGLTSLLLPQLVSIVLPVAVFAVVLFTYSRLVQDKEIVVMQAGGASVGQIARPTLILVALFTGYLFFSVHILEPASGQKFRSMQFAFQNNLASLALQEDHFNTLIPNIAIYVEKTRDNSLYNVILNDSRNPQKTYTVIAKKGMLVQTQKGLSVALVSGSLQEKVGDKITYGDFEKMTVDLGLIEEKKQRRVKPKEMYTPQLLEYTEQTKREYLAEFHKRFLVPFWSLISALLALCGIFSGSITGRGRGRNILFTSIAFIGLQALLLTGINLIKSMPSVVWGVYAGHLLLILLGFGYLWSKRKRR